MPQHLSAIIPDRPSRMQELLCDAELPPPPPATEVSHNDLKRTRFGVYRLRAGDLRGGGDAQLPTRDPEVPALPEQDRQPA